MTERAAFLACAFPRDQPRPHQRALEAAAPRFLQACTSQLEFRNTFAGAELFNARRLQRRVRRRLALVGRRNGRRGNGVDHGLRL